MAAVQPLPGPGVGSLEFTPGIQVTPAAPGAQFQISPYPTTSSGSGIYKTDRLQGAEMTLHSSSNKPPAGTGAGGKSEQRRLNS